MSILFQYDLCAVLRCAVMYSITISLYQQMTIRAPCTHVIRQACPLHCGRCTQVIQLSPLVELDIYLKSMAAS